MGNPITDFWKDLLPEATNVDELKALVLRSDAAFIHPKDRAFYTEAAEISGPRKREKIQEALAMVETYGKGVEPESPEGVVPLPVVPQPFSGDLQDPKVVVVSFNPGFQAIYDWALGRPPEHWLRGTREALKRCAHAPDRDEAAEAWFREQMAILASIRGGAPFIPWAKEEELPEPFSNWHSEHFAKKIPKGAPNYFRDVEAVGDKIAQIEIFPYQTPSPDGTEPLVADYYQQKVLPPSLHAVTEYLADSMSAAEQDGRIFIFRNSVLKTKFLDRVLDQVARSDGREHARAVRARCFIFSGTRAFLSIGNLQKLPEKPDRGEVLTLLQADATPLQTVRTAPAHRR